MKTPYWIHCTILLTVLSHSSACFAEASTTGSRSFNAPESSLRNSDASIRIRTSKVVQLIAPKDDRIKAIHVKAGDSFAAGSQLVDFECAQEYRLLRDAQMDQQVAQGEMQIFGGNSTLETLASALALNVARIRIIDAKMNLRQCTIAAPHAGKVVKVHVRHSSDIRSGQMLIDITSENAVRKVSADASDKIPD